MLTKEGVLALQKVKERILSEPDLFDMSEWGYGGDGCNTPCCIAGWLVIDKLGMDEFAKRLETVKFNIQHEATILLGYDPNSEKGLRTVFKLFGACSWPSDIHHQYVSACSDLGRAEAASKAIDWFIKKNYKEEIVDAESTSS